MYQDNIPHVLGAATTSTVGIVVLPATGGNAIFTIAAYSAITIGVVALAFQLAVALYRAYSRK